MAETIKKIKNIVNVLQLKKIVGVILIILGLTLHLIPLFPAGWIIFIGFELLGIHFVLQDEIKDWCSKFFKK